MVTREYYKSFREYCEKNPDRSNKILDLVSKVSIERYGYIETSMGTNRNNQDVPNFIREMNAANRRTRKGKSRTLYNCVAA